jgi:hypothetical protein
MRRPSVFIVALCLSVVVPSAASAGRASATWSDQANQVCTAWLAKAKTQLGTPVTVAGLYPFAVKAKALEASELTALEKIPGRSAAASKALAAVRVDIAEVDVAINAWKRGDKAKFIQVLKRYLDDNRPKVAFAAAGAEKCG